MMQSFFIDIRQPEGAATEIPVLNANNVDPDQTPRSAASDLGLLCLPMSHLSGCAGAQADLSLH